MMKQEKRNVMKRAICLFTALLIAVLASAETITVDDDAAGGNSYGNCSGFAIDFDTTAPLAPVSVTTGWDPALIDGNTYALGSIRIQYGGSVLVGTGVVYLGVYNGGVNGEGFLGASTNAIDFNAATTDEWVTFAFSGINVTADSVVGSGTGMLYFRYITNPDGIISDQQISTRRLNYDAPMAQVLAGIIAYNALQGARAPEYQAQLSSTSGNHPPAVEAGANQTISLPQQFVTVTGSVSDDGLGDPNGYLQSTWSQVSGPGVVTFITDIGQQQVMASFPVAGDYVLRLEATDGELTASDTVTVTIGFEAAIEWTAYNDCIGSTPVNPNTTDFTDYQDNTGVISGLLVNDAAGSTIGMPAVTFTLSTDYNQQPIIVEEVGSTPDAGTDAYTVFNGKVDFSGTILGQSDNPGWFVEITFSNLNPAKKYTFVGSAFQNTEDPTRISMCTIQGAYAFTNNSSNGIYYKNGDITKFRPCDNSNEGYVVRWDDILPGADGQFIIRTEADPEADGGLPLQGFMLMQIDSINYPPVANAGANQMIHLPRQYLALEGSATDDGRSDPDGYLASTWSQTGGPVTVEFADIHDPRTSVHLPAAGVYQLQLDATDGLLSAAPDTVTITVGNPLCPVGDVDGDCIVSMSDLGQVALDWLDDTGTSVADLDGDSWVKIRDLSFLTQSWLEDWTGSLQVTLNPVQVCSLGARWRVDGGVWHSSGAIVSSLAEGTHDIEYSVVAGWSAPGTQSVMITRQQTTQVSRTYSQIPQNIIISEFMAINSYIPILNSMNIYTRYPWNTGTVGNVYPDWIELHNNGIESINLAGWYLTDDPDKLTKWQFPSNRGSTLVLAPGAYIIVFASNKEQAAFPANYPFVDYYGALHTNFELSANGEYLAVVCPDGVTIPHEYNDYPKQFPFTSYGITSNGTVGYMTVPTPGIMVSNKWPGAANSSGLPGKVGDTKFSYTRGLYESPFDVTIACDTAGAEIHYTLDGTEPQAAVGGYTLLYSGPIPISTTTCLRAKAFKTGLMPSNVDTQTYLFLDAVVNQTDPPDSRYATGSAAWGGYPADFEMENNATDIKLVAGDAGYTIEQAKAVIKDALTRIPTLSVVSDPNGIFGAANGIYTHTTSSGDLWERAVSAEYFNGDPNDTFQIDCGFRIQGGASREPYKQPKHSLSLRFRGGYGDANLKTDIFKPQTDVDTFDGLQLRATYNNSWLHSDSGQRARATLIRDQFARDSIIAMGQESGGAGRFVHLYINGLYWGVYNLHERPEASHYANYYGGDSDWYDAYNGSSLVDGTSTSWNNLKTLIQDANSLIQADWEEIRAKLDIENVIDWTIVECWGRNYDLKGGENWKAAGGGLFNAPWQFYLWDTEQTLTDGTVGSPSSDVFALPFYAGYLDNYEEFRIQFADRLYKHFYNEGTLTYAQAWTRYSARATELQDAIIGESARWGDYRGTLYTKNSFWLPALSNIGGYLQTKAANAITYFRGRSPSLYPVIEPPVFMIDSIEQSGGDVTLPCTFGMNNPNGVGDMYYTLDGTDPRQYWTGNVSPTAVLFDGMPIVMNKSFTVKARVLNGTTWSALHEATYADNEVVNSLRITEIMYHPSDPNTEFIELKNIGAGTINLNLAALTNGISFTFSDINLAPNAFVVVVEDPAAFAVRYPTFSGTIAGQYTGRLDNAGEKIKLVDAAGAVIHDFSYKDGWYDLTDGLGFSLTVRDPLQNLLLWDQNEGWRTSLYEGGTPGGEDSVLAAGSIVINEVLAHSHETATDWIELYNTTDQDINIGGWFLTDNNNSDPNIMKYQIPNGTTIPANGYRFFVENTSFGSSSAAVPFGLSEAGETVYLYSGENGQVTGFYQTEENFDASETGVTFGRYEKTELSGGYDFTRMAGPTQGEENSGPRIPDIVITEIYYNPIQGGAYEFVELYNRSGSAVTLMSDAKTETSPGVFITESIPWRLEGTGYEFPANTTIPAGGFLIVAKDPTLSVYSGLLKVGPYTGGLDNGGEQIEIQIPGDQEYGQARYWIPIEKIDYDDTAPWPASADGGGHSLYRVNVNTYGRDYSNWQAATPNLGQ
jgi:hypothetical protein